MDELIAFARARLDDDEAAAKAAAEQARYDEWDAVGDRTDDEIGRSNWRVVGVALMETHPGAMASAQHIARHDPARALRDVAAKRAILELHKPQPKPGYGNDLPRCLACLSARDRWQEDWQADPWPCRTVRLLAAVWDGHPDYRQEWAP